MPSVYLVIHRLLPTPDMYFRDDVYSEPIEAVNATVVGVYTTRVKAEVQANRYFFRTLGLFNTGESENEGYYYNANEDGGGMWSQEVYVEEQKLRSA